MAYSPNNDEGRLFDNRESRSKKTQPDYTGVCRIDGKEYRVSAWFNPPREGLRRKSFTLRFTSEVDHFRQQQESRQKKQARRQRFAKEGPQIASNPSLFGDNFDHPLDAIKAML